MKKYLALIFALLLTASLLFGCGAATNDTSEMENGMGAVSDSVKQESLSEPSAGSTTSLPLNQKLVRKIRMDAETEDLDALLAQIDQRVTELGGYMEQREVYNGSAYASRRYRNASLTIRIPVEQLDAFVTEVSDRSNITSTNETTDNITLSYIATQSRITALETEQTRLLELLAQAQTMEDLLKIESRLTEVRTELEEVTSQLRLYDNLVDYGTIYLNISEVREYTVVEEPETVWERIGSGFMESLKTLGNMATELFVFLIANLPYFIIIAVIAVAIVLMVKYNKKRKKQTENKPENG